MKKIILFLVLNILFAACKKSSTQDPVPSKPLTDIDGNGYDTVKISSQFWMKQNLKTSHYRNGDQIPEITSIALWANLTTGAWCWYNNDSATYAAIYGKLYNWYAVNDPRGLAPVGYHIPSDAEWTTLSTFLGGDLVAGGKMKEIGTTHWTTPNTEATNSSGFTGLPVGYRTFVGTFNNVGNSCFFWSSTESNTDYAWYRILYYLNGNLNRDHYYKKYGFSVRCLRD